MLAMRRLCAAGAVAGALALGSGAAAQGQVGGQEVMLSNKSSYQSSLGDLPSAPERAVPNAAAPKAGGPGTYCNSFTCIPDGASPPDETITIHGRYDLPSSRAARLGRRSALKARSRK